MSGRLNSSPRRTGRQLLWRQARTPRNERAFIDAVSDWAKDEMRRNLDRRGAGADHVLRVPDPFSLNAGRPGTRAR